MNLIAFVAIATLTLAGALAAATLPNLVHAALSLVVAFVGVAAFYFLLGAEFVGLVQVLVYVGAVAVLIVFTILLTRPPEARGRIVFSLGGALGSCAVPAALFWALARTPLAAEEPVGASPMTVMAVGQALMTDYVWPLQIVGVVLTAALVGAVVLVMEEKR